MTDLTITEVGDAWVNSLKTGLNYGSTSRVFVKSGERRGYILPPLPPIAGRTVLSATLTGRVAAGNVAQNFTVAPVTERWSPGRVTWSSPSTGGPSVNTAANVTEVVGSPLPDGGLVEWDVTSIIASVAAGTEWFGLRVVTNSSATGQAFYSTDSGSPAWELQVVLSDAPEQPSNLRPDGGAVDTGEPILAWDFVDLGGTSTTQADSQIQVDSPAVAADPDEIAPDYDSGWVANTEPQYNLAAVTYTPPASPAQSTFWRVRVRDGAGIASDWSDWAEFTVDSLPTLVIDSPVGAFGDPTPQVLAHLTGGTLTSWKVWITGPKRSDVRAESGVQTGALDWTVPFKGQHGRRVLTSAEGGWIYVRAHDDVDRAVAVGQKAYVDAWIPVTLTESDTPTAPTTLSVEPIAEGDPRCEWTWRRTEAADGWIIEVDDEEVARLEPDEVTLDAGIYTWTDNGEIPPMFEHRLRVKALEGSDVSHGPTVEQAHIVEGFWVIPEDDDIAPFMLDGTAVGGFSRVDRSATYVPLEGHEIDVIYDTPGRVGTFEGTVDSRQDVETIIRKVEKVRRSRSRKAQLIWGSQTARAFLRSPDVTSHDDITEDNEMHVVRFGFVEVD